MDADSHDDFIISAKNASNEVTRVKRCKTQLEKTRIDVINCMMDIIRGQVDSCILMCQFCAFELKSSKSECLISKDFRIVQHTKG